MMGDPIYIFKSGTLSRKGNTIAFKGENNERTKYIPVENLLEIKIFGDLNINKRLLEFLAAKKIPMHFYNHYERYIGSFYPYEYNSNGITIINQSKFYLEEEKKLDLAKRFINGAMMNMKRFVFYYKRKGFKVDYQIEKMGELRSKVEEVENVDELMAIEGNYREVYYSAMDNIVKKPEFKIGTRERRPPTNFMNTMISFGNALMYSTVLTEIYKTPLDPRIGYLHSSNFRRFSLNLDIAEIFKPVIVDRTIFSLINRGEITESDFKRVKGGIHLDNSGKVKFIKNYEAHLNATIKHSKLKRNVSYRTLIRHEAYKVIKHILNEKEYKPFVMEW